MKLFLISLASDKIVEERKKGREGDGAGERRQAVGGREGERDGMGEMGKKKPGRKERNTVCRHMS